MCCTGEWLLRKAGIFALIDEPCHLSVQLLSLFGVLIMEKPEGATSLEQFQYARHYEMIQTIYILILRAIDASEEGCGSTIVFLSSFHPEPLGEGLICERSMSMSLDSPDSRLSMRLQK